MPKNNEIQNEERLHPPIKAREGSLPGNSRGSARKTSTGRRLGVAVLCLVLVLGAAWGIQRHRLASAKAMAATVKARAASVAPVVSGTATQKDVPIYLDGLGTVQAFNTVTVRARVDGELRKVQFVEGQDLHKGDVLALIDPAPYQTQVAQAVAKKGQDAAQLANALLDLKRDAGLVAEKVVSQQAYDTQKALVEQLEATANADQAAIDSAQVQLNYTTVVAPIDGRAGIRLVDQGNVVHASDSNGLVVLAQLRPISVIFTLPEQTLNKIQNQMSAGELAVVAMDRDNRTRLGEGKLAVIDNEIDTTTGTIKLKAIFPNDKLQLWPGQFVNARLRLSTRKAGVVVPASVIQRGPDGSYAFVIKADNTVEIRPVTVAQIEGGEALIDSGLRAGERVVVDGQYKLQRGSQVKPSQSAKEVDTAAEP